MFGNKHTQRQVHIWCLFDRPKLFLLVLFEKTRIFTVVRSYGKKRGIVSTRQAKPQSVWEKTCRGSLGLVGRLWNCILEKVWVNDYLTQLYTLHKRQKQHPKFDLNLAKSYFVEHLTNKDCDQSNINHSILSKIPTVLWKHSKTHAPANIVADKLMNDHSFWVEWARKSPKVALDP